jgi:Spy/CpxP family protein refolding chaperone
MQKILSILIILISMQMFGQVSLVNAQPKSLQQLFPALTAVKLTPNQQSQLEKLADTNLAMAESLLSPAQNAHFQDYLAQGKSVRETLPNLNLSFSQRKQIMEIFVSMRSQISQVLTPEQQQQAITYSRSLN